MKHRLLRVNELLKRELSSIITRELSFDGALVTLNKVDVTPDLKHAHAYVSVLGKKDEKAVMGTLESLIVMKRHEKVGEKSILCVLKNSKNQFLGKVF